MFLVKLKRCIGIISRAIYFCGREEDAVAIKNVTFRNRFGLHIKSNRGTCIVVVKMRITTIRDETLRMR